MHDDKMGLGPDAASSGAAPAPHASAGTIGMLQYKLYCCREGLAAIPATKVADIEERLTDSDPERRRIYDGGGIVLLPRCRSEDELLPQPPLAEELSATDIAYMTAKTSGLNDYPIAATCYGPEGQSKRKNEDFALAAVIQSARGKHGFAAVADGVSTKTFWAERASRLACIAAYKTILKRVPHWDGVEIDNGVAAEFRQALERRILWAFGRDREILLGKSCTPPDWAESLYQRYVEDPSYWYNTTLLVSYFGSQYFGVDRQGKGIVCFAGDGGIKIVKHYRVPKQFSEEVEERTPLASTENVEINSYVSSAGIKDLAVGVINYPDRDDAKIDIYLASDGPDRSLQRANAGLSDFNKIRNSGDAADRLIKLWRREGAESDNYSIALVRWPPPDLQQKLPWFSASEAEALEEGPLDLVQAWPTPVPIATPSVATDAASTVPEQRGDLPIHDHSGRVDPPLLDVPAQIPTRASANETAVGAFSRNATSADDVSIENLFRDICDAIDEHCKWVTGGDDKWCFRLLFIENIFGTKHFRETDDSIDEKYIRSIENQLNSINLLPNDPSTFKRVRHLYLDQFNFQISGWKKRGGPFGYSPYERGRIWERLERTSRSFQVYSKNKTKSINDLHQWLDTTARQQHLQATA